MVNPDQNDYSLKGNIRSNDPDCEENNMEGGAGSTGGVITGDDAPGVGTGG